MNKSQKDRLAKYCKSGFDRYALKQIDGTTSCLVFMVIIALYYSAKATIWHNPWESKGTFIAAAAITWLFVYFLAVNRAYCRIMLNMLKDIKDDQ